MTAVRRVLGLALLMGVSLVAALFLADVAADYWDLDFQPMASRANEDRILERSEFAVRVVTNELGFREPRLPGPKPPGTVRIVALGDSFTQGYGVEEDEAYPRVVERLLQTRDALRRYEVINLGVPGACPLDYLPHLRTVGLDYEPDLVLVGLMANDVNDLRALRTFGGRIVPSVLSQIQTRMGDDRPLWKRLPSTLWPSLYDFVGGRLPTLFARGAASDTADAATTERPTQAPPRRERPVLPESQWREVLMRLAERYERRAEVEERLAAMSPEEIAALKPVLTGSWVFDRELEQAPLWKLMGLVSPRVFIDMVLLPPEYDAAWKETTDLLQAIADTAERAGARTIIVFLPSPWQVTDAIRPFFDAHGFARDPRTLTDTAFTDRLRAFGQRAQIPIVDLLPAMRAAADRPLYFIEDGHWTPEGHALAARVIADAILKQ